jgi:hypothetical protein
MAGSGIGFNSKCKIQSSKLLQAVRQIVADGSRRLGDGFGFERVNQTLNYRLVL